MASVRDIAAYILRSGGPMTAMKLQKLVYYSQAWSIAVRGSPLFSEEVQAWAHGPVVYELFELHRGQFALAALPGAVEELSVRDRTFVDRVVSHYGQLSADSLSKLSHAEEPWRAARAGTPDGERASAVITAESMRQFYSRRPPPFAA